MPTFFDTPSLAFCSEQLFANILVDIFWTDYLSPVAPSCAAEAILGTTAFWELYFGCVILVAIFLKAPAIGLPSVLDDIGYLFAWFAADGDCRVLNLAVVLLSLNLF